MRSSNHFLSEKEPVLNDQKVDEIIRHALIEDIGKGDITTQLTIPKAKDIAARIVVKEDCIICGISLARRVFTLYNKNIEFKALAKDAQAVKSGRVIAQICGNAGHILPAERVALNFLSLLSGIATTTRQYVLAASPYKVKITDTRKTMPGLRDLQKYAVRIGGGYSHRIGLDEMILIKDNHIQITEGYDKLPAVPKGFKIEIEAQSLEEFKHALKFKPDVIMLDNMNVKDIREAVKIRNATEFKSHHAPTKLEASGGITLENVNAVAATGVEIISIGALTHSLDSIDISLDIV